MSPETVKAIGEALKPLADKLGQGAAHIYEVFVKQQYVTGVAFLIWGGLALLLAVTAAGIGLSFYKKWSTLKAEDAGWERTETPGTVAVVTSVATFLLLVVMTGFAASGVMHLLNPEYYAIQDVLCTVKDCQQ